MTEDTLTDQARAYVMDKLRLKYALLSHEADEMAAEFADFAASVRADAVREERKRIAKDLKVFLEGHCYTQSDDPLLYRFAAELTQEAHDE